MEGPLVPDRLVETTTEDLFAALDPLAREEAVALAARLQAGLQMRREEGGALVAAARAAGVENASLREAVARIHARETRASLLTSWPRMRGIEGVGLVPVVALLALLVTQGHAGLLAYWSQDSPGLWLACLSAGTLAFALPPNWRRVLPLALVAGMWTLMLMANHIVSVGPHLVLPLHPSEATMLRFGAWAIVSVALGMVASGLSRAPRLPLAEPC